MSNSTLKILPALMVAITAALVTRPVFGSAVHEFVLTENSSMSLTVTYDGSFLAVSPTASDHWSFSLPSSFVPTGPIAFNPFDSFQWVEPENSSSVNFVTFGLTSGSGFVDGDITLDIFLPVLADGTTVNNVGTDSRDNAVVEAVFHDNGDTARVPDTGTTSSLFGLSLMGLAFLRRKLC